MTEREALKLALEALHGFIPYLPLNDGAQCGRYDKAITAIKEALAQPEQQWTDETAKIPDHVWDEKCVIGHCGWPSGCADSERCRADNTPAQQQEPVALETVYETIIQWDEGGGKRSRRELARRIVSLYTTPPQRTWVGLTDEEIQYAFRTNSVMVDDGNAYMVAGKRAVNIARAIEAAHGIKGLI